MNKTKIVILEPHPDDLLFGPGPVIFDWISQGHEITVLTLTDGRKVYKVSPEKLSDEVKNMPEDEVAAMRIKESKNAVKLLGLKSENHYTFRYHDADGSKYVKDAVGKVKPILSSADRIVVDSNHSNHVDHQAAYEIAITAAKELNLKKIEFFVMCVWAYCRFREDSKANQIKVNISEDLKGKLLEWLEVYESQKKTKFTWKGYVHYLKVTSSQIFGLFKLEDIGKYYNF